MMVNNFGLLILCIITCEAFIFLKVLAELKLLKKLIPKSIMVLQSKSVSEHWKEVILVTYSFKIFTSSLKLCIALAIPLFVIWTLNFITGAFLENLITLMGVITTLVISAGYLFLRRLQWSQ
jgi:hypothetical protein